MSKKKEKSINTNSSENKSISSITTAKKPKTEAKEAVSLKKKEKSKNTKPQKQLQPIKRNENGKWSKSKKKRMRRLGAATKLLNKVTNTDDDDVENDNKIQKIDGDAVNNATKNVVSSSATLSCSNSKSELYAAFLERLSGSRFRELNEELYTSTSTSSFQKFTANPELMEQYHAGFRTQAKSWPTNPIDIIFKSIVSLQLKQKTKMIVADFGCGDAKLASRLLQHNKKMFRVHSFDFVSNGNRLITPADMANVPLQNETVDIGVFCLALMGTNMTDFMIEAHRVLKPRGTLKIAEVRSRFESTSERKEIRSKKKKVREADITLLYEFRDFMNKVGFECKDMDRSNTMFLFMDFVKNGKVPDRYAEFSAKPCIYKRR